MALMTKHWRESSGTIFYCSGSGSSSWAPCYCHWVQWISQGGLFPQAQLLYIWFSH